VTSIFMFHELPPKVRLIIFHEFARVLKPGGRLVVVDSLQIGDKPDYDGMLELFPQSYHEPYYSSYLNEDFRRIAADCGLAHIRDVNAFVSKVMVFDRDKISKRRACFDRNVLSPQADAPARSIRPHRALDRGAQHQPALARGKIGARVR
jgi:SAM-dependent methyltransferase